MRLKRKFVQVFTAPYKDHIDRCEVSAELVSIHHIDGWTTVRYTESDGGIWENRFPDWNISMIRISDND